LFLPHLCFPNVFYVSIYQGLKSELLLRQKRFPGRWRSLKKCVPSLQSNVVVSLVTYAVTTSNTDRRPKELYIVMNVTRSAFSTIMRSDIMIRYQTKALLEEYRKNLKRSRNEA